MAFSLRGTLMHTPARGQAEILTDALVCIGEDGVIATVTPSDHVDHAKQCLEETRLGRLTTLADGQYILPGLVDTHVHAPQWPQLGKALHLPLEVWLQEKTFPLEAKYADAAFASRMYESLVNALLANGTTTAVYFATIHQDATRALVDICNTLGQRGFVGKVAMDNADQCPAFYRDASVDDAVRGTRELIEYIQQGTNDSTALVRPIVTPRFIPSCTDALLTELGQIAAEYGCHIQTHCSESDWEHQYVIDRLGATDTLSLDRFGLLGRRTVLAHGNLLADSDLSVIAERGAGIAHCPLSNVYFSNSAFPLRTALAKGVHVGLGTDISGGPSASMFVNCRHAVSTSRMLEEGVDPAIGPAHRGRPDSRIDFSDAFWLATCGGAEVLDIPVGRFAPGCYFDAMVIDVNAERSDIYAFDVDSSQDLFQKIVYGASQANIQQVWVNGRQVVDQSNG